MWINEVHETEMSEPHVRDLRGADSALQRSMITWQDSSASSAAALYMTSTLLGTGACFSIHEYSHHMKTHTLSDLHLLSDKHSSTSTPPL